MSGETTLKFLIPGSLCQQDFTVSAVFDDRPPENVLRCDWVEEYDCNSAPGYTYTIGNHSALLTVPRDLKETPEAFICELFGQPKTDRSSCLCVQAAIIIPGQPDSDSPGQVGLISALSVISVLLLLVLVGLLIYIRCYRQNSSESEHGPNVSPDKNKLLSEANKDAPKIFLTDSQKSSTATLICVSCGAVQLIKMLIEAKKDAPKISATDSQKSSTATVIVPPTETVTPKKKPIEAKKDAPKISLTDSQKSSTATVICFSCGAVQLIKIPTSQTSEPSMDVPQMSAADLQESSTPAVTPPPTETVPPKKETKLGRNKTHP